MYFWGIYAPLQYLACTIPYAYNATVFCCKEITRCREVKVQEGGERVHRFYIIDATGRPRLAAEGRSNAHHYESPSFTFSPHPEFTEVLPMRSGSSACAIRTWLQRLIRPNVVSAAPSTLPPPTLEPPKHRGAAAANENELPHQLLAQRGPCVVPVAAAPAQPQQCSPNNMSNASDVAQGECSQCHKLADASELIQAKFGSTGRRAYCHVCHRLRKRYSYQVRPVQW